MVSPDVLSGVSVDVRFRSNFENLSFQAISELERMVESEKGEEAEQFAVDFASRFETFAPGQTEQVGKLLLDYVRNLRIQACSDIESLCDMMENWSIPLSDKKDVFGKPISREPLLGEELAQLIHDTMTVLTDDLEAQDNDYATIELKVQKKLKEYGNPPRWNGLRDKIVDLMTKRLLELNLKLIKEKHYEVWQPPVVSEQEAIINRLMTATNILWLLKRGLVGYAPTGGQMGDLESGLIPDDIREHSKFRQALYDHRVALEHTA